RFRRFFMHLSLLTFALLVVVLADNLVMALVAWGVAALAAYLLVGFYYERPGVGTAAGTLFWVNRLGDAGLLVGTFLLWSGIGTLNFAEMAERLRPPLKDAAGTLEAGGQLLLARHTPEEDVPGTRLFAYDPEGPDVILLPRPSLPEVPFGPDRADR